MSFLCPYCDGELSPPTRKRSCPHCQRTIFARMRPNHPKAWVRKEDLPVIVKEWADAMSKAAAQDPSINPIHANRDNLRAWVKTGTVKSVKVLTAEDDIVCQNCERWHRKVLPITTPEEINPVMNLVGTIVRECSNVGRNAKCGCRCYWRPEEISIDL